ncbi:MAG: Hsp70 family protein [Patescibacteria group bacterium]|nr:Hsp70 family protein [Patescibacteria group bacterium]
MKNIKFGLDFGTTNSSISMAQGDKVVVLPVDMMATDPRVVRSMLYFFRRELVYKKNIPQMRITRQAFMEGDIQYEGEFKTLIGQGAVNQYLVENKNRKPGIRRIIFTGRWIRMRDNPDQPKTVAEPEHYEEVDYGTGRLLQALKSSLRTSFRGTSIFGKYFTVEELVGLFIKNFKEVAERESGQEIEEITVGRPVHFSDDQEVDQRAQNRLAVAMKSAGFKKLKFQFEPVAAAKQFLSGSDKKQTILVFDFGGGTLDTAIVRFGEKTEVLATDGVYIGGDLLNADIMQAKLWQYFGSQASWGEHQMQMPTHIYEALNSWYSIPNLNNPDMMNLLDRAGYKNSDPEALSRLVYLIKANVGFEVYEAIEKAKKALSQDKEAVISYHDGPIDLEMKITREEFEKIIRSRVEEVERVVWQTLEKAKLEPEQIDKVVRTGGSSLIPIFEQMLIKIFGKEKITLFETFTSIAAGLALE